MILGHAVDLIYKINTLAKYYRGKPGLRFYLLLYIHTCIHTAMIPSSMRRLFGQWGKKKTIIDGKVKILPITCQIWKFTTKDASIYSN